MWAKKNKKNNNTATFLQSIAPSVTSLLIFRPSLLFPFFPFLSYLLVPSSNSSLPPLGPPPPYSSSVPFWEVLTCTLPNTTNQYHTEDTTTGHTNMTIYFLRWMQLGVPSATSPKILDTQHVHTVDALQTRSDWLIHLIEFHVNCSILLSLK